MASASREVDRHKVDLGPPRILPRLPVQKAIPAREQVDRDFQPAREAADRLAGHAAPSGCTNFLDGS